MLYFLTRYLKLRLKCIIYWLYNHKRGENQIQMKIAEEEWIRDIEYRIGQKIHKEVEAQKTSIEALSKVSKVSKATIYRFLNGGNIEFRNLLKIMGHLHIDIGSLDWLGVEDINTIERFQKMYKDASYKTRQKLRMATELLETWLRD